jgi:photosystem II stability/assembly factor-like uncharacterized protein
MKKTLLIALGLFCGALLLGGPGTPATGASGAVKAPGKSGESAWTPIGPYGGYVHGLARNAKFPNEIYVSVGDDPSQIYRSTNGGDAWARTIVIQDAVIDVAADPGNADVVYAYAKQTLYRSSDRGATFPEAIPLPDGFRGFEGRMAILPSNVKTIFLAGSFMTSHSVWTFCPAVAKTEDGGQTWTVTKFEPTATFGHAFDIGIPAANPDVVYLCTRIEKPHLTKVSVYRSSNGGTSYANVTDNAVFNAQSTNYVDALAVHPTDPNTAWVAHTTGVARTTDGGKSWRNQSTPAGFELAALAPDAARPRTLYGLGASAETGARGCWKSTDAGATWTNYDDGIYGWGARILVRGSAIIAGTEAGLFKSRDAGVRWTPVHAGIRAGRSWSFAVSSLAPSTIYAGVDTYGLFRTTNGGGAWNKCPDFFLSGSVQGLLVHPADPKTVFFLAVGCSDQPVYRSTDGGRTRTKILDKEVSGIFGDPKNLRRIAATGRVYNAESDPKYPGLYLTSNGGAGWTPVKISNQKGYVIEAAAFAPSSANVIYAGGHTGGYSQGLIYKTVNGGASWARLPWTPEYITCIAVDAKNPDIVYAGTMGDGVYRSADGGGTWVRCSAGADGEGAYSIVVNGRDPDKVVYGGRGGVFLSTDRGLTWTDISEGLLDTYIHHVEFHAASRTLFVGTSNAGIWKKKL